MRKVVESSRFRRDLKRCRKRGLEINKLKAVIRQLVLAESLPEKLKDHALTGNWKGYRECQLSPDWLLIYRWEEGHVYLARTGSHADLFDM